MGSAASTLLIKGTMSKSKRPIDASDLIDPLTGRQDRRKAINEIKTIRKLCKDLLEATSNDPNHPSVPAVAIQPPSLKEAHMLLKSLLPKRKLDFEMLGKLPAPCIASKTSCQSALQLCLDETTTPSWHMTQEWLKRRPFNDVRFLRIEENPTVWVSFETVVSTLKNLITINTKQLESLGVRGIASRALWMWSLAVCSVVLEKQDKEEKDINEIENIKNELWGKAWETSGFDV